MEINHNFRSIYDIRKCQKLLTKVRLALKSFSLILIIDRPITIFIMQAILGGFFKILIRILIMTMIFIELGPTT